MMPKSRNVLPPVYRREKAGVEKKAPFGSDKEVGVNGKHLVGSISRLSQTNKNKSKHPQHSKATKSSFG